MRDVLGEYTLAPSRLRTQDGTASPTTRRHDMTIRRITDLESPSNDSWSEEVDYRNCCASSWGLKMPRSVIMAVIYSAGVTSNAGLKTMTPLGAIIGPLKIEVTSCGRRCSIGISLPDGVARSIVE